ncbi:hypothetical protein WJX84_003345 [Apatococcus fuscideae]|uniref:2-phosphoglycerate kinase n=1 Tax=Apatococcus fuscideae TaxID=2026836 RepID=A0AAW1TA24_9CHLO
MGCKPRYAHKVCKRVFAAFEDALPGGDTTLCEYDWLAGGKVAAKTSRDYFQHLIKCHLQEFTGQPLPVCDFNIACSIREQARSVTVLLAGTSGTGKSTLASLLAARLGVTTVLSTDSIRHMMRGFTTESASPLLWASTYSAGDLVPSRDSDDAKTKAVKGYKAQAAMVVGALDQLVGRCEARRESLVCEGVHLSIKHVVALMQRHPTIVPFLVHISNEAKHRERFAVRAKYMTLEPGANRYVKYIRNIRDIQGYLLKRADRHLIPAVDNTNVDRSVATLHATVLGCLRRMFQGESLLDASGKSAAVLAEEWAVVRDSMLGSKAMLQRIQAKIKRLYLDASLETPSPSNYTPRGPSSDLPSSEMSDREVLESGRSFQDLTMSDLTSSEGSPGSQGSGELGADDHDMDRDAEFKEPDKGQDTTTRTSHQTEAVYWMPEEL